MPFRGIDEAQVLTSAEGLAELEELTRPLVREFGMLRLGNTAGRRILAGAPPVVAELTRLEPIDAERSAVAAGLALSLLEGLAALPGPVALSVAVGPDQYADAVTPGARFALRLGATRSALAAYAG